jgi:serine/threonine protein kinase
VAAPAAGSFGADVSSATEDDSSPESSEWETVSPEPEPEASDAALRGLGREQAVAFAEGASVPAMEVGSGEAIEPASLEFVLPEAENAGAPRQGATREGSEAPSPRRASVPPFIDELPDSVTPYEQRISETVKVADLPPVEQLRGRVLANRYLAEEVAEKTAASVSYKAYHLALDRAVTVRILPRGLACVDEACQEVRRLGAIATGLGHPHVAGMLDFGVLSDGWPYLVTEQLQGKSLSSLLSQEGKFVIRRVLHIGKHLAAGLGAAHAAGLVHALFSPDNVVVLEPGSLTEVATIIGFGVSSARGSAPGPPRSGVFGVPFYVSPEQASCRPLDARSDIYSLGVILYELMTGMPPFSDGDFAGVLCQHLDDEAPPPSSRLRSPGALAKAMDAIVQRCLRKDPAKRYQSAGELEEDLVRLEAAAERTKRRPMPEVKRPTATIHSPHRKAESVTSPGAKVIVHDEPDGQGEDVPRDSRPSIPGASPPGVRLSPVPGAARSSPLAGAAPAAGQRRRRVGMDQATIKISGADRDRILGHRPGSGGSNLALHRSRPALPFGWLQSGVSWLVNLIRRVFTATPRRDDSPGS